jgi:hypothetical protein
MVIVDPWKDVRWDAYVASHPRATVYHTAAWIRIVCETGRYPSLSLLNEDGGRVTGVMPLAAVDSTLTGRRISTLPFSDACFVLADDTATVQALLAQARVLRNERRSRFHEMRGLPALRDGSDADAAGYAKSGHFYNYLLALDKPVEQIRSSFGQKSVRYMITKAEKAGVTVRRGSSQDVAEFYRLYVLTRRRHGIPPQPLRLFSMLMEGKIDAALYLAIYQERAIAAAITARYLQTTFLKYEVTDDVHRNLGAVHVILWQSIQDAMRAGDSVYDFGRTAADNTGLCEFKSRWGTTQIDMPYYFDPPAEGMSVVRSESLKYRLFTGAFRRMPPALSVKLGERIFRHFG